jgi:ribosomal protein L11 methylase PrmA
MDQHQHDSGSFRDRNARVFLNEKEVYRGLGPQALKEWETLAEKKFFLACMSKGQVVQTEMVDPVAEKIGAGLQAQYVAFLKHQKIPFVSYAYEWPFGMLKDAALLQLDLLLASLDEGMILKDSSHFNFQWQGAQPIFIDTASFEVLRKGEPWVGYRQFCEMFLFPLMLQAYKDVPYQSWLRGSIDGINVDSFAKLLSARDLLRSGVLLHAYLQSKAQSRFSDSNKDVKKGLAAAGFSRDLIKANVKGLRNLISKLTWNRSKSEWSHYAKEHSYTDNDYEIKKTFVRDVVHSREWSLAWDIGCNTGTFSRIAAEKAKYVVAMDLDQLAVEYLYQELKKEGNTRILPLVGNLADPAPNLGWRGMERKSLPERGRPELTLCLALIHHIVISANIPMQEFVGWLADLGTSLVIEFVTKQDEMVEKLLRNKIDNYADYEVDYFEKCLAEHFRVEKRQEVKGGKRILYFARPR